MYPVTPARTILDFLVRPLTWAARRANIDHKGVVELMVKDYLSRTDADVKSQKGRIVQDYISRHLFNSTACVSDQLAVDFRRLGGLVDHVLSEAEARFNTIPLVAFKGSLLEALDREYDKLSRAVPGLLQQSQLLQCDILNGFQNGILNEKEKGQQRVETCCAMSEQGRAVGVRNRQRWYQNRTIQGALITAAVAAVLWLASWLTKVL